MPGRPPRTPSYRFHKARDCAVVTIGGKDHYLGPYGSPESRERYDRLVAEWLAAGRRPAKPAVPPGPTAGPPASTTGGPTVNDLILEFVTHADGYYRRPNGTPTTEVGEYKRTLGLVRGLYGRTAAAGFGPAALRAVRDRMVAAGWSRGVVNQRVGRVKRVFKWGVERELVPPAVFHGLAAVRGLARGRSAARETGPVRPVPAADVDRTLPFLNRYLAALVQVQLLTGMRPGEACRMRGADIDASGPVWLYRPVGHKTAHHGHRRVVPVGPRAQDVLRPFLAAAGGGYLFSPRRAAAESRAARAARGRRSATRTTRRVQRPRRGPGEHYQVTSYAHAVAKACERAGVPAWHPHRLRHTAATAIRREFGLDAARVVLGHRSPQITEVYAELDVGKAVAVMERLG